MDEPLLRHAPATVHGRYLVVPARTDAPVGWLVGFHGYAQSAAEFLPGLVRAVPAGDWLVTAVQALHPFYTKGGGIVANWMTREDRELAIADNIGYTDAVCDALEREFGGPRHLVFAGFSQGVAMAYRAALQGRRRADALFTVGSDTPPELHHGGRQPWPLVVSLTGARDEFYTEARLESDAAVVRAAGGDVRTHVFEGGHAWEEPVVDSLARLLTEVARSARAR